MADYKNKITRYDLAEVDSIVFNPNNWRIHPKVQKESLDAQMEEIGWVQPVVINETTGNLIDGHLRVQLAEMAGMKEIPAVFVRLSEEEELIAITSLDSIAAMAVTDKSKLEEVISQIQSENEEIQKLIGEIANQNKLFKQTDRDALALQIIQTLTGEPKHKVNLGDIYLLGGHRLICASPITDAFIWGRFINPNIWFLPYPNPLSYLIENSPPIIGVTPSEYTAGHILDRWSEINGEETIEKE